MALATGGTAVGAIRTRSRPISWAFRKAAAVGITSVSPLGKTARTSRARIVSFTFSLRFCLRGGNFLPGVISYLCRCMRIITYIRSQLKRESQKIKKLLHQKQD